jgi:nicotinamide-nucleotide amidase
MEKLAQEIGKLLRARGMTLGVVESATGGLISHLITDVAGSSDYFNGGITTYSNAAKEHLAGVSAATLKQYGAVSHQTAREMAAVGQRALGCDITLSTTGIAGPGGATPQKPVGLFYIGLAHGTETESREYHFTGDREQQKQAAATAALGWLRDYLLSQD